MSRRHHRPPGARVVTEVAVVKLGRRKGLVFNVVEENGARLGEILHVKFAPGGRAVTHDHAQRVTLSEPVTLSIIEALAGVGVRLREARS